MRRAVPSPRPMPGAGRCHERTPGGKTGAVDQRRGRCRHRRPFHAAVAGHGRRRSIRARSAPGDLFVAIRGPRLDGHDFLDQAFANGAAAALVSRIPRGQGDAHPLMIVEDTYSGLKQLACAARRRARAKCVAVTGSVGKTSTKEALAAALAPSGPVAATYGNLNNLWGVPLSLARMPAHAAFGVFEIGMNHAGEITPLVRMVRPEVAIITTVEAVHLEFFDSVEGIAHAKAEIFDGLRPDGTAVLNRDNRFFEFLCEEAESRGIERIVSFGEDARADVRLISYTGRPARACSSADVLGERDRLPPVAARPPFRHQRHGGAGRGQGAGRRPQGRRRRARRHGCPRRARAHAPRRAPGRRPCHRDRRFLQRLARFHARRLSRAGPDQPRRRRAPHRRARRHARARHTARRGPMPTSPTTCSTPRSTSCSPPAST